MTTIREIDLEFSFSGASDIIHFDCDKYHAGSTISHVDFIVEYDNCYLFIEVKDPDMPGAKNLNSFVEKMQSGKLVQSLADKFRDTFFFGQCRVRVIVKSNILFFFR